MCLDIKERTCRRKAMRNILVYIVIKWLRDRWTTPYRGAPITPKMESVLERLTYVDEVNLGLHSLVRLKDAKEELRWHRRSVYSDSYVKIVKCIIPKGAYYYKGIFDSGDVDMPSYASTKRNLVNSKKVLRPPDITINKEQYEKKK